MLRLYEKDKLAQRFFQKAKRLWDGAYKNGSCDNSSCSTGATRIVTTSIKILQVNFGKSNENVRKQHLSTNAYFCVNMKFSYMIAGRKDVVL